MLKLERFLKDVKKRFENAPDECHRSEWVLEEITCPDEIQKIAEVRKRAYENVGRSGIVDPFDNYFDWDRVARHFKVLFRVDGGELNLSKAVRVFERDKKYGIIPTELNIYDEFYEGVPKNQRMSKWDRERFARLLSESEPSKTREIGGFVNFSDVCEMGSMYRFVWMMADWIYNSDTELWIQTQSRVHSKFYYRDSGLPYNIVAGDLKNPYTDHAGRDAVTLSLEAETFRPYFERAKEDELVQRVLNCCPAKT